MSARQLPAEYAASLENGHLRKFRHKDGFEDSTDFVGVDADGNAWLVSRNGWVRRGSPNYLARALEFVTEGSWIEVTE